MFGSLFEGVGRIIGTVTGIVLDIPLSVVAKTLDITEEMVQEAKDSGCETYEEIKEFFDI